MSPSPLQRRVFATLSILYGAVVLGFLPWAERAVPVAPNVVGVYGIGILFADLCTVAMLARQYSVHRRPSLLVLVCAYLFSAGLVLAYTLSFNGALGAARFFGTEFTAGLLFLALRLGTALLFILAVGVESRTDPSRRRRPMWPLYLVCAATVLTCVGITYGASLTDLTWTLDEHFSGSSQEISGLTIALYALGAYMIWRRRAFNDPLYLWLALILVASAADLTLSTVAGARFTLGWYLARCSSVVSSYMLLTFLLGDLASAARSQDAMVVAVRYAAAIAIATAAIVLRWFLLPWLKTDVPYATLFGAIAVAVWMGGWGPAAVAALVGLVGTTVLIGTPESFTEDAIWSGMLGLIVYVATCILIIGLGETMRKARDDYRRSQEMFKEVALELKQRAADLQQADSIKSLFLATLSHELRNPLAPIRNGIAILKRRMPEGPADVYAMMDRQLGLVTRLIDDLLDVSRLDRGKLELHRENVAVESFVNAAIETARPNIEGKSHELVVSYAPCTFHVDGDPTRLAQVIANLLNNAAKYTPPSGRIELSMRTEGPVAVISVRDNGIGIAPADLGRIFDTFVQLDASKTQAAAGLGLGLALARSLVTLHGGEIKVHSEGIGKGSEFDVHLPLAQSPATSSVESREAPARETQGPAQSKAGRRVLIVDDNADATQSLATLLESNGYPVRSCFDGATGFETAKQWNPDVAFIDLNMPPPDGIELVKMIRKQPWGKGVKLIALTGMGQPADLARTHEAGFDEHLTKPASAAELLRAIAAPRYFGKNVVAFRVGNASDQFISARSLSE
jgi:signal transduction histidine kinase/ActR/RegA family two-component response regulator